MRTISKIIAIGWKDALLNFSSRSQILFFIVLPVVFIYFLGSADQGGPDGIPLLVTDLDQSALSAALIAELASGDALNVLERPLEEAEAAYDDRDAVAHLVIDSGFEGALTGGERFELRLRTRPNNNNALAASQSVNRAVSAISEPYAIGALAAREAAQLGIIEGDAMRTAYVSSAARAAETHLAALPSLVETGFAAEQNADVKYDQTTNSAVGQMLTWVFIPLLGTSVFLAFERAHGTLRRLLTTPTRQATYLLGAITGQLGVSIVQMALLIGFSTLVMGVSWGNDLLALALMLISFALAAVALGVTLGTLTRSDSQANNLSIMLGMTMSLLGGAWFPLELFPASARAFANILPTKWAMQGMLDLTLYGRGLVDVLPEAGILIGFAAVFFAIGVWRFKFEA